MMSEKEDFSPDRQTSTKRSCQETIDNCRDRSSRSHSHHRHKRKKSHTDERERRHHHHHHHRHHHHHHRDRGTAFEQESKTIDCDDDASEFSSCHRVGQLRPENIPEDLEFSDAEPDGAFPLTKEQSMFTGISKIRCDNDVDVTGRVLDGDASDSLCHDGDDMHKLKERPSNGKIVIQLKPLSKVRRAPPPPSKSRDNSTLLLGTWKEVESTASSKRRHQRRSHSPERDRRRRQRRQRSRSPLPLSGKQSDDKTAELKHYLAMCRSIAEKEETAARDLATQYYNPSMVYAATRHPFAVDDNRPAPPAPLPSTVDVLEQIRRRINVQSMDAASLTDLFPVSCGVEHRDNPASSSSMSSATSANDVSSMAEKSVVDQLVSKRFLAQRRLQFDPYDYIARQTLTEVERELDKMKSKVTVEAQKSASITANAKSVQPQMLTPEELASGRQAWAKKDQFSSLQPVKSGVGLRILHKMGWREGQALGKSGKGAICPLEVAVKFDRKGLSSEDEVISKKKSKPIQLEGRHPVSVLMETCARRQWPPPLFVLAVDEGLAHAKDFQYKVYVRDSEFRPKSLAHNKKEAKMDAAVAALLGLGIVTSDQIEKLKS